ncbi:hypothetical protein [Streptomyces chartreusis]|uniref:hypothetical protein n=1 Tax=Streptomyces chartreusis TaxID=1969 RepID=UPI002F913599|nr:hypothetical protein OG938_44020 [Streptomyces chartreusis]WSZ73475.1 hypothetical protein OG938_47775 [Streptomyces chartreusis]WTA33735.1 hypothetical protein OIA45_48380 [Streptomyces chartreusis]
MDQPFEALGRLARLTGHARTVAAFSLMAGLSVPTRTLSPRHVRQEGNVARSGINKRELDKWTDSLAKETKKSLERAQRRHPARMSAQLDANVSALSGGELTESSGYLDRLLLLLDTRSGRGASLAQIELEFQEDLAPLALRLEQRGLVRALRAASGLYAIHLSDEGLVEVHRLKELQKNRAARLRHTMDAFHRWLFNTAGDREPINPVLFLDTSWSFFAGAVITESELHEALGYLSEYQLIEYLETEPVTVAITPQGVSCALAGGSVQDHVNRQRPGTTYNTFLPNAQGVIIGEQQNVTQNNTAGIDPSAFVQLAGYVGQISNTLGMPETDRVELERVAQELHDEATSPSPEPGRMRQFATQVKAMLVEAGATAASQVGIQMAEQALGTLL